MRKLLVTGHFVRGLNPKGRLVCKRLGQQYQHGTDGTRKLNLQ